MFRSDTHIDRYESEYNPTASPAIITKTQIFASVAVSLGSMIVGYSSAWSSPAIASLMEQGSHIEVYLNISVLWNRSSTIESMNIFAYC